MNVLITCDRLDCMGGLEEHVVGKVKFLLEKGVRVHLDCNAINEHYFNKLIGFDNFSLSSPWIEPWTNVFSDIKGFKPDIIHAHPFSALQRGVIVKNCFNCPIVFSVHGEYAWKPPENICNKLDKIIIVNNKIKGYESYNSVVIENGIDINRFKNTGRTRDEYERTIVLATRLQDDKEKPVFDFIDACCFLPQKTIVYIVGGGKHLDSVKDHIRTKNYDPDKYEFNVMGEVINIEDYLNIADLVLACDRIALEALACDKNVFYMGQGHWKDYLTVHNYKEYLFTNEGKKDYDSIELAEKITESLHEPKDNVNLGSVIRKEYSIESKLNQILDIYLNLLERHSV